MTATKPSPPLAAPKTISQVDRCYDLIRSWIVSCDLAPGERLNERDLIQRTGFGRTPVREALLRLDHDGLISTLPRSGYQIAPLTEKSVDDYYDVWRLLGPLVARLAVDRMTPAIRAELVALTEGSSSLIDAPPAEQTKYLDRVFRLLGEATGNDNLVYILHRLSADQERMFNLFLRSDAGHGWFPLTIGFPDLGNATNPDATAAQVADNIAHHHRGILAALREQTASAPAHEPVEPPPKPRGRKSPKPAPAADRNGS